MKYQTTDLDTFPWHGSRGCVGMQKCTMRTHWIDELAIESTKNLRFHEDKLTVGHRGFIVPYFEERDFCGFLVLEVYPVLSIRVTDGHCLSLQLESLLEYAGRMSFILFHTAKVHHCQRPVSYNSMDGTPNACGVSVSTANRSNVMDSSAYLIICTRPSRSFSASSPACLRTLFSAPSGPL